MTISVSPSSDYAQVQARLSRARFLLIVRTAARGIAVTALFLLILEVAGAFLWYLISPATVTRALPLLLPAGMGLTGLAGIVGVVWSYVRLCRLSAVAGLAQDQFPDLGMRLTASLEAPGMAYCPPTLRQALWADTLGFLDRTPLGRMISVASAVLWLLLAIVLVGVHVSLGVPELRGNLLSQSPLSGLVPPAAAPAATEPKPAAERPFFASLKILHPTQDFWATKIEAVPFSVFAASSHGLTHLRLQATVNGEQTHAFALQDKTLAEDTERVTAGDLFLDELELADYSLVTVQALAEATKPDGTHVSIASQPIFIQIRPFRRDIYDTAGGGMPDKSPKILMIRWLIEAEKKILRQTAALGSALDHTLPSYERTAGTVGAQQDAVIEKAQLLAQGKIQEAVEKLDAASLGELQSAIEQMGAARGALQKQEWASAQVPEDKALTVLVNLLRHEIMKIQKPTPNSPPGKPPIAPGPKDRQQVRQEKQKLDNLEQLAQQQDAINLGSANLNKGAEKLSEAQVGVESRKLAEKQNELAGKTHQLNQQQNDESQKELLSQAEQRMRENTEDLRQRSAQAASPKEGENSNSPAGLEAARLLRQAAARQQAQLAAAQAEQLRQMLGDLTRQDQQLKGSPAVGTQEQQQMGQEVGGMSKALGQMANEPGTKANVGKAMQQAQGATGQAAAQLEQGQGQGRTLEPSVDAVAKAHQEAVGQPAELAELKQQLQELLDQLKGLKNQQDKSGQDGGRASSQKGSEAAGELTRQLAQNGPSMEAELKIALGQSAGVKEFHEQMKDMLGAGKDDGPKGGAQGGGQDKGQGAGARGSGQGAQPGDSGRPGAMAGKASGTQGNQGQGNQGQGNAAEGTPAQGAQGSVGQAVAGAGGNASGDGQGTSSSGGGEHGSSSSPMKSQHIAIDGNVVVKLDVWIDAVSKLQSEVDEQMKRQTPADLLRTMFPDDAPSEYRPLVNDYYNRLSRSYGQTMMPAK